VFFPINKSDQCWFRDRLFKICFRWIWV